MLELESVELLRDLVLEEGIVRMIEDYIGDDTIIVNFNDPVIEYLLKTKDNIDIESTQRITIGFGFNINDIGRNLMKEYPFNYRCKIGMSYDYFFRITDEIDLDNLFVDFINCGYTIEKKLIYIELNDYDLGRPLHRKYLIKTVIT